ncbi:MAG: SHOCT domain-containing protein [Phycisphaerae bacterium]|nr:SHOCT domain-containing protein [Phycisphaerae bacterium]
MTTAIVTNLSIPAVTPIVAAGIVVPKTHAFVVGSGPIGGASASQLFSTLAPLLGLLVVVVLLGAIVIYWVRRYMRGEPTKADGFSLEELRQMHRRGEMNDEEFARAKSAILGRARDANRTERETGGWEESGRRGDSPPSGN